MALKVFPSNSKDIEVKRKWLIILVEFWAIDGIILSKTVNCPVLIPDRVHQQDPIQ